MIGVRLPAMAVVRQAGWREVCRSSRSFSTHTSTPPPRHSRLIYGTGLTALLFLAIAYPSLGKDKVLHSEAPAASRVQTNTEKQAETRLDPSTSLPFPLVLPPPVTPLPRGREKLNLVGLGVRTVSFLGIRVYVAGLYVDSKALQSLTSLPGWKGFEAKWMTEKTSELDVHSSEVLLSTLLDSGAACAIRIVPTRSTDFNHLRDGFTRAVQNRAKLARKDKQLSAEADESLNKSMQELKEAFPKASLPKGRALDLLFIPSAAGMQLTLEEDGKVLGSVRTANQTDRRYTLPRQLFLAYFANKDEISKPFKESVAQGLEEAMRK